MLGTVRISGTTSAFNRAIDRELHNRMKQANIERDLLMAKMYQDGVKGVVNGKKNSKK